MAAVSAFQEWIDSFEIFSKYLAPNQGTLFAEDGYIWAGPSRSEISEEDQTALEALGWEYDEELDSYFMVADGL